MIVAITTAPSHFRTSPAFYRFVNRCLQQLALQHPEYRFVVISDRNGAIDAGGYSNFVYSSPKGKSSLAIKYWYDYQLPRIVKKQKADAWLALDGLCSLRSGIPQLFFINDLSFLQPADHLSKKQRSVCRSRLTASLQKAQQVITLSGFSKTQLTGQHTTVVQEKIKVWHPAPDPVFHPVDWEQKEKIKEKYAEGKEYFLFPGAIDPASHLHQLLKAYSVFKKRQKTNMLLLIAGPATEGYTKFTDDLASYKYRHEVKLLGELPVNEMALVMAGAYALLQPLPYRDYAWAPAEAMLCDVPVLAGKDSVFPELCGDAAVYADPSDINDIAQHMMLLFKDETERDALIRAGRAQVRLHTAENAVSDLEEFILAAANG